MEEIIFSLVLTAFVMGAAYLLYRVQRWASTVKVTSPPQTDWDSDQLLVVNMLELSKYRKDDTLHVHTQRTPDGKTLVFNVAIWWPVFTDINTQKVTVFNVKSAGNHVLIGGTIEL